MRNKKNFFVVPLAIAISLLIYILLLNSAQGAEYDIIELENKSEEELIEELKKKELDELVEDINRYDFTPESEALFHYAAEIVEKIEGMEESEILTIIRDGDNSEIARVAIIQACTEVKMEISHEEVVSLINDDEVPFEVKRNVLINNSETGADIDLLKDIAAGDDELAVQALQLLNNESREDALSIAEKALDSYENISDMELAAALDVKALALSGRYSNEDTLGLTGEKEGVEEFVEICDDILNNEDIKEAKYGAMFALSDVLNEETITYIIESDLVDDNVKIYSIDQNMKILKKMLEESPTPERIAVVLKAMEIMPLNDLREPLENLLTTVDSETEESILLILEEIENRGEDSVIGTKMFE